MLRVLLFGDTLSGIYRSLARSLKKWYPKIRFGRINTWMSQDDWELNTGFWVTLRWFGIKIIQFEYEKNKDAIYLQRGKN